MSADQFNGARRASNASGEAIDRAIDDASAKVLTPVERLELSRARMRVFLDKRKPVAGTSGPMSASSVGDKMSEWVNGFRANPVLGAVIDAVQGWWATHPLHAVTLMAGDAVEDIAAPWIRRYPLAVVGGALAVGVVASKLKPWRLLGSKALLAGLTSQIAAQLMTHAPLEFLIDAFTKFAKPKKSSERNHSTSNTADRGSTAAGASFGMDPTSSVLEPLTPAPSANQPVNPNSSSSSQPQYAGATAAL